MDPSLIPDIVASIHSLIALKYITGAGLAMALWDHAITLQNEVQVIWHSKTPKLAQFVFVLHRYGLEAGIMYMAYVQTGFHGVLSDQDCRAYSTTLCLLSLITSFTGNAYMAWRHYVLWDYRKSAIITLGVALGVLYGVAFVFTVIIARDWYDDVVYSPIVRTCLILTKPKELLIAYGCGVSFDLVAITLALLNNLHRPHRCYSDVLAGLRRDGASFFMILFALRLSNLILIVLLPPLRMFFVFYLLWAAISITISRLILRVEALKGKAMSVNTWVPATNSFELGHWSQPDICL